MIARHLRIRRQVLAQIAQSRMTRAMTRGSGHRSRSAQREMVCTTGYRMRRTDVSSVSGNSGVAVYD
jgi:hypothetical protein